MNGREVHGILSQRIERNCTDICANEFTYWPNGGTFRPLDHSTFFTDYMDSTDSTDSQGFSANVLSRRSECRSAMWKRHPDV